MSALMQMRYLRALAESLKLPEGGGRPGKGSVAALRVYLLRAVRRG